MYEWLKKNTRVLIVYGVIIGSMVYLYSCESTVRSMENGKRFVTRPELQIEINTYLDRVDIKFASLDRQDRLRQIVVNNAMLIAQGSELNPVGILTGLLSIYGIQQVAKNTTGAIKNARNKRTNNKSPTA
ncbi:unnamed protein product [marine sediment metagenome]|uniref:Uncharacterized protein n=1 Tax=marine sediment metagenome TaxID=412755 RepID=X0T041_9ZZZZ